MAPCYDIAFRFDNHQVSKTNNPAVFIKTPNTQKQGARKFNEAWARSLRSKEVQEVPALSLIKSAPVSPFSPVSPFLECEQQTSSSNISRFSTLLEAENEKMAFAIQEMEPEVRADADSDSESKPEERSDADSDSASESEESNAYEDSDDSDGFELSDLEDVEFGTEVGFIRSVALRSNEQVMVANLKHLASKAQLRYGSAEGPEVARRTAVGQQAANFTEMYSDTVEILQASMTWKPPSRKRHSIDVSDLRVYCRKPSVDLNF